MTAVKYADEYPVRRLMRTVREETVLGTSEQISGSQLLLSVSAKSVYQVKKNGTVLTPETDYTFSEPLTITFAVAPASTDVFLIEYFTDLTSAEISDAIVKASAMVNEFLNQHYAVPFTQTADGYPPTIVRITEYLAAYYGGQMLYTTEQPNRSAMMEQYRTQAMEMVQKIWKNEIQVVNADGSPVSRKVIP